MPEHYVKKCVHGTVVEQCRCPSPAKTVTTVPCPGWSACQYKVQEDPGRYTGYVPYFDCPRCGRHRLEASLGIKYVAENQTASYIVGITCEKCGWNSDLGKP
jgi:hypothetical protein